MAALGTRLLTLSLAGTDVTVQCSVCEVTSAASDSDFTSFADAASGGARDYALHIVAVQDLVTGTIWDKIFTAAGTTVAFIIKPYGNAAASTTQPHISGNATIVEPEGVLIGGQANSSTSAKFTIDVEWPLTAKPTRVTT